MFSFALVTDVSSPSDKHVTVKFVQDTSKFWYKPEISREQGEQEPYFGFMKNLSNYHG